MEEGDHPAARSRTRLRVDWALPGGGGVGERAAEVGDFEREVVQPFAPRGQESREWTVLPDGLEQLEEDAAGVEERDADAFAREVFAIHDVRAEEPERPRALLDAAHGDSDVVESHRPLRISSAAA